MTKKVKKSKVISREAPAVTPKQEFKLSIVIPCYNEEKRIQPLITALQDFSQKWKESFEIIVVDDGSTDNVVEIIAHNNFLNSLKDQNKFQHILLQKNSGKGNALKVGVSKATGTHILTMDADLSYHPKEVLTWLERKNRSFNNNEILLGSRLHKESEVSWEKGHDISNSKLRMVMGFIYNFYTQIMTTLEVRDNQSGFKLYPADVAKFLFSQLKSKGWAHDVELLYFADLNGIEISEMPVKCINREGSKINIVKDSFKMFFQTFLIGLMIRWKYYIKDPVKIWFGKNGRLISPVQDEQYFKREAKFRVLFVILSFLLLFLMPYLSKDYGIAGDEWIQNKYGLEIYDYFFHGSSDAYSATGRPQLYDNIILYSGGFEFLTAVFINLFPDINQYDIRHFINAIFGFLLMLFTGLLAKRIGGWRAGFIALIFIALSPRIFGHSMNNSKDIPFAFAVIFTLYHMIPLLRNLPKPSLKYIILVTLGIAIAINIRVGGWILFGYLGLFMGVIYILKAFKKEIQIGLNKDLWQFAKIFAIILVVGYFMGLIFWPYAHLNPITNPYSAFEEMSGFSVHLRILFAGGHIFSDEIPWNYTLIWLTNTSPEIILIYAILFLMLSWWVYNYYKNIFIWFLLFSAVFPVAYAVYQDSPLYDGWRHFLFVYPSLVILAGLTMDYILVKAKPAVAKYGIAVVTAIGLFLPLKFMIANHPNEYVYFNDISGGLENAYGKFETDYYMNSIKENFYETAEMEDWYNLQDTIVIASNTVKEVGEYAKEVSGKIKPHYIRYSSRSQVDWDYAVLFSRYIHNSVLKGGYWPPKGAINIISADDVPLSVTVKRVSKEDYLGYQAMQRQDYQAAVEHFKNYLQVDTTNEQVYLMLGQAHMNMQNYEDAADAYAHASRIDKGDINAKINLGLAYLNAGKPQEAQDIFAALVNEVQPTVERLEMRYRDTPEDQAAFQSLMQNKQMLGQYLYYLGIANAMSGNIQGAINNLNQSVIHLPDLRRQAYSEIARIYQQLGDMQKAQQYQQLATGG